MNFLQKHIINGAVGFEEVYAYTFGSVGFVRFDTTTAMYQFLKTVNDKQRPQVHGRSVWISTSKSAEERAKSKYLSKFKKVLLDTNLAEPDKTKVDYKRDFVFVANRRVAAWKDDKLVVNHNGLLLAEIEIESSKPLDAVEELVRN